MQANEPEKTESNWQIGPAAAAWLLPGLGHILLGQRKRGLILAVTILTVWLAGVLVGGISVLDRQQQPIWFLGQMLMAPSVAVNAALQHQVKPRYPQPPMPHGSHAYEPSFGRANEQGVLYTALAGLLNLLAILDVVYRHPKHANHFVADDRSPDVPCDTPHSPDPLPGSRPS